MKKEEKPEIETSCLSCYERPAAVVHALCIESLCTVVSGTGAGSFGGDESLFGGGGGGTGGTFGGDESLFGGGSGGTGGSFGGDESLSGTTTFSGSGGSMPPSTASMAGSYGGDLGM